MIPNVDLTLLLVAVMVGIAAHIGLVVASRWTNALFLTTGAFIVICPLAAAIMPWASLLKLGRVYCTVLSFVIGLVLMRLWRPRPAGLAFLAFATYYFMAASWSEMPIDGLKFKGLYLLLVLVGLMLAYSVRDARDLANGLRAIALCGSVLAAVVLVEMVRNPYSVTGGRFTPWGINPNTMGREAALLVVVCAAVALYDRVKAWKVYGYVLGAFMAFMVLATGSRASTGMAAIGTLCVVLPFTRRPALLAGMAVLVGVAGAVILPYVEDTTRRLTDTSFENRAGVWGPGWQQFKDSPIIGHGWVFDLTVREGASSGNLHSMYLSILVEIGAVGAVMFLLMILYEFARGLRAIRLTRGATPENGYVFLAGGIVAGVLGYGTAESGPLTGSTACALALPFALALLDRLPEMVAERSVPDETFSEFADEGGYGYDPEAAAAYAQGTSGHPNPA